jgi:hypothetical protein
VSRSQADGRIAPVLAGHGLAKRPVAHQSHVLRMANLDELPARAHWCGGEIAPIRGINPYFVMPQDRSPVYEPVIRS